jgi:DNA-binding NarL/FixJ family response regulator
MTDIVLADDHVAFVEALGSVLTEDGYEVRAVEHTAAAAVATVRRCRPALCLLDRWFEDGDVLTVLPELRDAVPATRIVVLTADPDRHAPVLALQAGAHGFVHKTRGVSALLDALERVAAGSTALELPPRWTTSPSADAGQVARLAAHLTAREHQCLTLLVEGASTPEMAARLEVGTTTVRTHVQSLLTKLGVHTRLEAAAFAVRSGLVVPAAPPAERRA